MQKLVFFINIKSEHLFHDEITKYACKANIFHKHHYSIVSLMKQENHASKANFFHKVYIWKKFSFYALRKFVFIDWYFPQTLQLKNMLLSCNTKICLQMLTFSTNINSEKLVLVWNKEICIQKLVFIIDITIWKFVSSWNDKIWMQSQHFHEYHI